MGTEILPFTDSACGSFAPIAVKNKPQRIGERRDPMRDNPALEPIQGSSQLAVQGLTAKHAKERRCLVINIRFP